MSNETRKLPDAPGWWWCKAFGGEPAPRLVIDNGRILVVNVAGTIESAEDFSAFEWLAPIPGPEVCAALAEWFAAHELDCTEAGHQDRFWDAEIALADALRAERDGAA